ncbi:MAG: hypothetical protein ETSY1_46725 (plasmid) [Candidatus Entotheonella factor]|uniref:HTH cro/C1-type domain-containing protein n=1 Tax=Entotheonella factor TaxID=1429438 RepID=W4M1R0_ENTF1|nr:MAG: hypothetical protein ETSY1_46725 [Candidatus Entotheonella factor]
MSDQEKENEVKEIVAQLGQKLRAIRREKGLTQDELWDMSDVQQGSISRLERGLSDDLMLSTIFRLTGALEADPIELLREARDAVIKRRMEAGDQEIESELLAAAAL